MTCLKQNLTCQTLETVFVFTANYQKEINMLETITEVYNDSRSNLVGTTTLDG